MSDKNNVTSLLDVLTNQNLLHYCIAPNLDLSMVNVFALATGPTLCEKWRQIYLEKFNSQHGLKFGTFETVLLFHVFKSPESLEKANGNLLFESGDAEIAQWVAHVIGRKFATDKLGKPYRWDVPSRLWKNTFQDDSVFTTFRNALEISIQKAVNPKHGKKLKQLWKIITKHTFQHRFPSHFARHCNQLHRLSDRTHLIPVKGGMVLDLKTKMFRVRDKSDCCTFELDIDHATIYRILEEEQIPVESQFHQFLRKVCCNSMELLDYVQRVFGCLVAGDVNAKKLGFLWHGSSNSGKSTLVIDIVIRCFQNYFQETSERIFKQGAAVTHDSELFDAQNAPTLYCDEMPDKYKLMRATVNRIVGATSVRVRNANAKDMTSLQLKKYFLLLVNHLPCEMDADTLEKIVIIPMLAQFVSDNIDPVQHRYSAQLHFAEHFLSSSENVQHVYQFVLVGALRYWRDPMGVRQFPKVITDNRSLLVAPRPRRHQYHKEVREFALENLELSNDYFTKTEDLANRFLSWNENGPKISIKFGKALTSVYGAHAKNIVRVPSPEQEGVVQRRGFKLRFKRERELDVLADEQGEKKVREGDSVMGLKE